MEKVTLSAKFALIEESWRPKIVGEFNGQAVKLVKFRGRFVWHHHDNADEMFLGYQGTFRIEFRDHVLEIGPGEFAIVPKGVEHRTAADDDVEVIVIEPVETRNTGNVVDPRFTVPPGDRL